MGKNDSGKKRVGVMGGSFDPVHKGHVRLAQDALEQAELDYIAVVPAGRQPFKLDVKAAEGKHRMEMLKLAFKDSPRVYPCSMELDKKRVSYTYLTLRALQEELGKDTELFFIVGADSILKLETWKNSEELLNDYSYIVGSRPGYEDREMKECIRDLEERYGTRIIVIENELFDISSTEIREKIAHGDGIARYVGKDVEKYIKENGLYR